MLPAQKSHLPGLRNARAEFIRFPQAEQIQPPPLKVHQAHPAASSHGSPKTQSKFLDIGFVTSHFSRSIVAVFLST